MNTQRRSIHGRAIDGGGVIFGVLFVLSLWAVVAGRHPQSIEDGGGRFLLVDVVLLVLFGAVGMWAAFQRNVNVGTALQVGTLVGLVIGSVDVAHHAVEFFVPLSGRAAQLILGAGHMLSMLALFSFAGSATWERTRSIALATVSGAWSAVVSVLILLAIACSLNFALGSRTELHLHEAFLASGMSDPDAFLVKNAFEAASEALVRIPVLGLLLSFAGALGNDWISRRPRSTADVAAWLLPLAFAGGAISLWYADSLQHSARPPFILIGLILAGISLAGATAVWSALRRSPRR